MRLKFDKKRSERGQSFMELAISIVFLLTLLAALIDLGWAFYTLIALRDAAQEAAVYGSMCPHYPDLIRERLEKSASAPIRMEDIENIEICVIDPTNPPESCAAAPYLDPAFGLSVRVEAEVLHEIRTPFVGNFINAARYPLRVDVSDTILRVNDVDCH